MTAHFILSEQQTKNRAPSDSYPRGPTAALAALGPALGAACKSAAPSPASGCGLRG